MSDSRDCLLTIAAGTFNSNEICLFEYAAHRMLCAYIWAPLTLPEFVIVEVHPDLQDGGPHGFTALQSAREDIDLPEGKVTAVTITVTGRLRLHADTPVAADRAFRWLAIAHPGTAP